MEKSCPNDSKYLKRNAEQTSCISDPVSPTFGMSTTTSYVDQEPGNSSNYKNNKEDAIILYAYNMHYARQYDEEWKLFCLFLMHMYLKTVRSSSSTALYYGLEECRLNLLPDDILHIILEYFDGKECLSLSLYISYDQPPHTFVQL